MFSLTADKKETRHSGLISQLLIYHSANGPYFNFFNVFRISFQVRSVEEMLSLSLVV